MLNFDCHVDAVRLFGDQEAEDLTTATQLHE